MKRTESENDKSQQGLWNGSERLLDGKHQGLKKVKPAAKSFALADQAKRQFACTLKRSKCSSTDVPKSREEAPAEAGKQQKTKYFEDVNIERILVNSEYFKMKNGNLGSVSFCSGEKGEHRWTVKKPFPWIGKALAEEGPNKAPLKKSEPTEANELRILSEGMEAIVQEMKALKDDFDLVRTDVKTIEKHLRHQKAGKAKHGKKDVPEGREDVNQNFPEEVEKAAHEPTGFVEDVRKSIACSEGTPDFDKIIKSLQRLSETAYQPKITQTSKGARFEVPKELSISFFADGMLLRNNEFRTYTDIRACLFLRDIEDGFFPSELWPEFPYGVPFQVTDRRFEAFGEGREDRAGRFPGSGRRLGSAFDGKPPSMVYLQPMKAPNYGEKRRSSPQPTDKPRSKSAAQQCRRSQGDGENAVPKPVSLKVRLGFGSCLRVDIMPNEKMNRFQDALFRKLCEKYHDDYAIAPDGRGDGCEEPEPDFEVHVYGRKPFRLSENLNLFPSECGLVDGSVVNVTEL